MRGAWRRVLLPLLVLPSGGDRLHRLGAAAAPCASSGAASAVRITVARDADVTKLADAVDCNGGNVVASWTAELELILPIHIGSGTSLTVLGDSSIAAADGAASTRLFVLEDKASLTLRGMTLRNGNGLVEAGYIETSSKYSYLGSYYLGGDAIIAGGGAIYAGNDCQIDVSDCVFEDNHGGDGGAVYMRFGSSFRASGSTFRLNSAYVPLPDTSSSSPAIVAGGFGGAIYITGSATVTDCFLVDNWASFGGAVGVPAYSSLTLYRSSMVGNSASGSGGALFAQGYTAIVVVTGGLLRNNRAQDQGGAVLCSLGCNLTLSGTNVTDNSAAYGGGLKVYRAWAAIRGAVFEANSASFAGGGANLNTFFEALVQDSLFSGNYAGGEGGGFYALDGELTPSQFGSGDLFVDGCRFVGNSAAQIGGAASIRNTPLTAVDCSFRGNTAAIVGSTLHLFLANSSLENCDILDDSAGAVAALHCQEGLVKVHASTVLHVDELGTATTANATKEAAVATAPYALFVAAGTDARLEDVTFSGFWGAYLVRNEGETLIMDGINFSDCTCPLLVTSSLAPSPPVLRNAQIGAVTYEAAAAVSNSGDPVRLVDSAVACGDGSVCGSSSTVCVDGAAGIYCVCYEGCISGVASCVGSAGNAAPESVNVAVPDKKPDAFWPDALATSLTLILAAGAGPIIWQISVAAEIGGVDWTATPSAGILSGGESVAVQLTAIFNEEAARAGAGVTSVATVTTSSFLGTESTTAHFSASYYLCEAASYWNGESCVPCNELDGDALGADCSLPGVLLETLPISPGYWRTEERSTFIYECYVHDACAGASAIHDADAYCSQGYMGPYCAVCEEGWANRIAYECRECSNDTKAGFIAATVVAGILILISVAYYLYHEALGLGDLAEARGTAQTSYLAIKGRFGLPKLAQHLPLNALRIPIVVLQIIAQFVAITGLAYAPLYQSFTSVISAINLDMGWVLSVGCMVSFDFYQRLLLATIAPLVMLLLLACSAYLCVLCIRRPRAAVGPPLASGGQTQPEKREQLSLLVVQKHVRLAFVASFLIYSTVSTIIFQTFVCDTLADEDGEEYMRADYSISCRTDKYRAYRAYASVMILIYPIGIPAVYGTVLWRQRGRLLKRESLYGEAPLPQSDQLRSTAFLWTPYVSQRFYWELIECARRLLLTGFLVFILPNTSGQAALACLFAVASLAVFAAASPLSSREESRLYIVGCIIIFCSFYSALLIKVQATNKDSQSQRVLSILLIALNVSLIIAAVVQCVNVARSVSSARQNSMLGLRSVDNSAVDASRKRRRNAAEVAEDMVAKDATEEEWDAGEEEEKAEKKGPVA